MDDLLMPFEGVVEFAAGHILQPHYPIQTGTDLGGPIRRKRHPPERIIQIQIPRIRSISPQGVIELSSVHIPQPHRAVSTAAGQGGSVRRKRH